MPSKPPYIVFTQPLPTKGHYKIYSVATGENLGIIKGSNEKKYWEAFDIEGNFLKSSERKKQLMDFFRDMDTKRLMAKGGNVEEITKEEWKSILSKFLKQFYGDYEDSTVEDYENENSVTSDQAKYYWANFTDKYKTEKEMSVALSDFLKSLTEREKGLILIKKGAEQYADAEEHDRNKIFSTITIIKKSKAENYAKGGGIGFEKLSNKVAKNYEGKKVAPKYQHEYGKTYSRAEAKEVGDKVAGKVYWQQQGRMATGGNIKKYEYSPSIEEQKTWDEKKTRIYDAYANSKNKYKDLLNERKQAIGRNDKDEVKSIDRRLKNSLYTIKWAYSELTGITDEEEFKDGGNLGSLDARISKAIFQAYGDIDDAIEFKFNDPDSGVAPYRLVFLAVQKGFITPEEINKAVLNSAYETSSETADAEEIGSSDMNFYVWSMLRDAGFDMQVENGTYVRVRNKMAEGGNLGLDVQETIQKIKSEYPRVEVSKTYGGSIQVVDTSVSTLQEINSKVFSGKGSIMKIGGKFSFAHGLYYPPMYKSGGGIDDYVQKSRESQAKEEKGKYFSPYRAFVYEDSYQFADFKTDDFHKAVKWAKEMLESQRAYRKNTENMWAIVDEFTPIEERTNVIYPYKEVARFTEENTKEMKFGNGGNTTFYHDQAKKTLGEHLYYHIASLNKEQLEKHLSHLQKEIERMKAEDTEFTKQEFLPKYKQEEKFILYLLERLDEFKYADGGNVEEDKSYNRTFRNNAGKDVTVKIVKNPIFGKYDYWVDGSVRGQFDTYEEARAEVNYENFDMYKRGGRLDDETRYEQLKNDIIKQSDYYEKGDGFNSRFIGAKNDAGDEANGEYTIEGNTILWTYTDKQGRDYNSSEMPSFTVNLSNTNVRLEDGGNIYSKEESLQIARTILQQMGGQNRLVAFTGAYGFAYADGDVSFRIKNRKVNYVKVKLNGKDLYDVTFGRVSGTNFKVVEQLDDVYAEDLIDIFEKSTGMYLRFEKGGKMARGGSIGKKIDKWKKFVLDNKSWFDDESEDDEDNEILLTTRKNGDVGNEEWGREDVNEAKQIVKKIISKFPTTQYKIEQVDEYVYLYLRPSKSEREIQEEKEKQKKETAKLSYEEQIINELGYSKEKTAKVVENLLKYPKEYYEKNKNRGFFTNDFRVLYKSEQEWNNIGFKNIREVFDYITNPSFANGLFSKANPYTNRYVEVLITLYGWDCIRIKYNTDDFPYRADGETNYTAPRGKTLSVYPFIAVNIESSKDLIDNLNKAISDFIKCYEIVVLEGKNKYAKGGGIEEEDFMSQARTSARESIDWEEELRNYAGDNYKSLTAKEKEEIIAELKENYDYHYSYAKGGLVVTSIKDIPNFKEELDAGRITYRGLGMGKLSMDFYKIAGEGGTRIKVKGKEYYITDSEFDTFSRDSSGKMRIKFDAPHRRFAKGGNTDLKYSVTKKPDESGLYYIVYSDSGTKVPNSKLPKNIGYGSIKNEFEAKRKKYDASLGLQDAVFIVKKMNEAEGKMAKGGEIFNSEFYKDGGSIDINFAKDTNYIKRENIKLVKYKNGKELYNWDYWDSYNFPAEKDELFSGIYVAHRPLPEKDADKQYSMFKKGGNLTKTEKDKLPKSAFYIKRSDIDSVIIYDEIKGEEVEIPANRIVNGIWFDNHRTQMIIDRAKKEGLIPDKTKKTTTFIARFNGKKIELEAKSMFDAQQKALKEFKVPKSKRGLLSVMSKQAYERGDFQFN